MKKKEIDVDDLLKRHLPKPSIKARLAAEVRTTAQLKKELDELTTRIHGKREMTGVTGENWPGKLEPLVLAAAFLLRGEGDAERVARLADEFAGQQVQTVAVRFTLHRLVWRGLLTEKNRQFTVTPEGERALTQVREAAKRWIQALERR
jgi:hypothetical protein